MQRTSNWITGTFSRDFLLTAILFVWLYQLLAPLGQAGGIPDMDGFYLFVALLLGIELLVPARIVQIGLKLALMFSFMHYFYFFGEKIWEFKWILDLGRELSVGFNLLVERNFTDVPEITRTFLFLLFLWLTASVYRNAMISRVWLFVLLFIGELVIGVIDTFFPPDASGYVVRYFLLGVIMLSLSQLPELEKWARIPKRMRGWPAKWVVWTLVVTASAVGTGMAAPKLPPSWPDPVSFLQGKAVNEGLNGPKKIGYGNDDSNLGGPYEMDETIAFTVLTNQEGYYRGESKAVYTGKGWADNGFTVAPRFPLQETTQQFRDDYAIQADVRTKYVRQQIQMENGQFDVLLGQYQIENVQPNPSGGSRFSIKYFTPTAWRMASDLRKGTIYDVVSHVPFYDPEGIQTREEKFWQETNKQAFMDLIRQKRYEAYMNLPGTLPQRVRDLAVTIAGNKENFYEKAKAIEEYLRTNYTYETKDVPFPAADQDFVDQFLFDSQRGYCDHFSSSMVVLARSVGMPARWVKGFTAGEQDTTPVPGSDMKKYLVRNKNAHSWVEVWIPGTGWVPFEPTATFAQPVVQEVTPVAAPEQPAEQTERKEPDNPQQTDDSVKVTYEINWRLIGSVTLALCILLLAAGFLFRRRLLIAFYLKRSAGKGDDGKLQIVHAIDRLLTIIQRFGLRRDPNVTVREFGAEMTAKGFRGNEWIQLVRIFERVRYGNKPVEKKEVMESQELWERIVRKIGRTNKR
ncbi:DUF4129 domain-containing transglutaminase family protein [Effusibacillus lacus]|uniref:Transglutaminase-like domain-containing protein n=1 Tax=Effusibacillus lacus TaxID=1348429 RepID=A0A292YK58_9BACL|nr:transglutaminase domain-containing protein [Effusibacillus lacus]TCS74304.1 uncharacterized protein DUF4129 [Effusibacillus lacus]GAX88764.1 hypothetical protein EFBL_0378 [Effusibacillus lacus]